MIDKTKLESTRNVLKFLYLPFYFWSRIAQQFLWFQAAYSQLIFAGKRDHDPVSSITDEPRIYLAQGLHKLSTSNPGMVGPLVAQLEPVVQGHIQKYLQQANLTI